MKVALWAEIRRLHEIEGLSARAIARRLHCCTKTVAKALTLTAPPAVAAQAKESIFAPYRARIDALLAKYPDLSAVRVVEEIARGENGYRGSVYPVRRYLHQARPVRGRVYQEVLYEPGEALQVDWGDCGRVTVGQTPRKVSVFVAVLCYSRLCYIEFSLCQRKAEFYRALVHALEFFQGSPRKIIFDNLKAAVTSGSGRSACLHPEFLALCGHFCLEPIACAARDPESKGIVEGGVRYVKHNALAGRGEECGRGRITSASRRGGATRWPMSVSTPLPRSVRWTAFSKSGRGSASCRPSPSTPTRCSPSSSRPRPACVSTAIVTRCRRGWSARRSCCGPAPVPCGSSTRARKWSATSAVTRRASCSSTRSTAWPP